YKLDNPETIKARMIELEKCALNGGNKDLIKKIEEGKNIDFNFDHPEVFEYIDKDFLFSDLVTSICEKEEGSQSGKMLPDSIGPLKILTEMKYFKEISEDNQNPGHRKSKNGEMELNTDCEGKDPIDLELFLAVANESLAPNLAKEGYEFKNKNTLKVEDAYGRTVAHDMVRHQGHKYSDPEILKLADEDGWTVAHEMVNRQGHKFTDPEILKLVNNDGWTVAHEMVSKGYKFETSGILSMATSEEVIVNMRSRAKGLTVAHMMAEQGHKFSDPEILKLANEYGETVAHVMTYKGHKFSDPEILKLANNAGNTIAHGMAERCYKFTDPEILKLTNKYGHTVAHKMGN
ncbi:MAG: hypothetical protein ACOC2M_01975, partial [bacterium]